MTLLALTACALLAQATPPLPAFDFRQPGAVAEWGSPHDITRIEATGQGMAVHLNGEDPYFSGPPRDYPAGQPLLLKLRLKSSSGGPLFVFYFGPTRGPDEQHVVYAAVKPDAWQDLTIPLPALGPGARLRIDPPGTRGVCVIESIRFEPRLVIASPEWPRPTVPHVKPGDPMMQYESLTVRQDPTQLGGFMIDVDGQPFATGHNHPMIGYVAPGGKDVRWIDVASAAKVTCTRHKPGTGFTIQAEFPDPDGGNWKLWQRFGWSGLGSVSISAECSVDAPRDVVWLPLLLILPGHGSFGAIKGQGLFAGVEYLENEPSSSTADLNEQAGANRRVPDSYRITFPLMAIQTHGRYLGLIWDRQPDVAALFDSPDRTFGSESHVFGLIAPGANVTNRASGDLFPYQPMKLERGRPISVNANIVADRGASVVPAVQKYIALRGYGAGVPRPDLQSYVRLAAAGWLDTPIRQGHRFRHAVGGSFGAHPAADAAWMMEQLAALTTDPALAERLGAEARAAADEVPIAGRLHAGVAHVQYPLAPLVLANSQGGISAADAVVTSLDQARAQCQALMKRFEPDGSIRYRPALGATDFGRTHFSDEASGLTALPVAQLLEAAVFAGDRHAVDEGLRLLRILRHRFAHGVPRGAQTWEIPLHTPDILASAHLVKAFTLGYELTGEAELLDAAKYWAWTGVPFVFLVNPTDAKEPGAVGPFATTPVLGATNWVAPNWIGMPVQWCGLVYADALAHLAAIGPQHDGMSGRLAWDITASAISQTYPMDHPHHGLLPDSFNLPAQSRNPADINPGTLQPLAIHLLGGGRPAATPYQFRALRASGLWIHAAGAVRITGDEAGKASFTVRPWSPRPSFLMIHGLGDHPPGVQWNGQPLALDPPHQFLPDRGTLVLQLVGQDCNLVIQKN